MQCMRSSLMHNFPGILLNFCLYLPVRQSFGPVCGGVFSRLVSGYNSLTNLLFLKASLLLPSTLITSCERD